MSDSFDYVEGEEFGMSEAFDVELTRVISNLYIYMKMLGEDRTHECALIRDMRMSLVRIRTVAARWLKDVPPKSEEKVESHE